MQGDTEFWISHVDACHREGMTASAYARQHGLALGSLYYWRSKLKLAAAVSDSSAGGAANKFVALRVVDADASAAPGHWCCAPACAWS